MAHWTALHQVSKIEEIQKRVYFGAEFKIQTTYLSDGNTIERITSTGPIHGDIAVRVG